MRKGILIVLVILVVNYIVYASPLPVIINDKNADCWTTAEGVKCDVADILLNEITFSFADNWNYLEANVWNFNETKLSTQLNDSYLKKDGSNADGDINLGEDAPLYMDYGQTRAFYITELLTLVGSISDGSDIISALDLVGTVNMALNGTWVENETFISSVEDYSLNQTEADELYEPKSEAGYMEMKYVNGKFYMRVS